MKYVALLRGINVGGKKSIKMDALNEMMSSLGYKEIITYIQSGNVVFDSNEESIQKLQESVKDEIKNTFGHEVPVLILRSEKFINIFNQNPFIADPSKEISLLHVTFLSSIPVEEKSHLFIQNTFPPDEFFIKEDCFFLYCPNGYSNSKLSNTFIESKLKVDATTRNWKTVKEIVKML
jgi:uncharacterized protein (DUF1697 family)